MTKTEISHQSTSEFPVHELTPSENAQSVLYNQAIGHEERVPHLVRLELDETLYPAQNVDTRYIDGSRIPSNVMHDFVVEKDSRYPSMLEKLTDFEAQSGLLTRIGEHMKNGGNVILMCEHEQVTDLGFLSIAYAESLEKMDYSFHTSIIAGKMIPYLGYEDSGSVIPLTTIMEMGGDRIYLSYPPETKSTLNSGIPSSEIRKNNVGMGKQLASDLDRGGWLVAMDPLGTTLKIHDGIGVFESEGMSAGTIGILMNPKTLVLANGLLMSGEDILFDTDGVLRQIGSTEDVQRALNAEAKLLSKVAPHIEFISPRMDAKLFEGKLGRAALASAATK